MSSFTALGTVSPFNSSSFNAGSLSIPDRESILVNDQMILSSLLAAPLSNLISVMLVPSTWKFLRFLNLPLLKTSLLSVYALCRSLRHSKFSSSARTFRSSWLSKVPVRVTLASCFPFSENILRSCPFCAPVLSLILSLSRTLGQSSFRQRAAGVPLCLGMSRVIDRKRRDWVRRSLIASSNGWRSLSLLIATPSFLS
ncbi:hypothetical protein CFC21_032848 [Triticum aestivum]|uniref:Uncharacterized protein n=2 Tax=Triticum aestivum TaxID=4565 RepID=A0A3B6DP43_WHEAT|nr:hypothetical protein CFC21_032848 [Triticum aestivum]